MFHRHGKQAGNTAFRSGQQTIEDNANFILKKVEMPPTYQVRHRWLARRNWEDSLSKCPCLRTGPYADYLLDKGIALTVLMIGYDTRFASEDFAAAVSE